MKVNFLFTGLLLAVGCSHVETPVSQVVSLPYEATLVTSAQVRGSRAPASVNPEEGKSPRRVYFSALYHQYLTLGTSLHRGSTLKHCPQFHHDKLDVEKVSTPRVTFAQRSQVEGPGIVYFPEFAFGEHYTLLDHHRKLTQELATLCEEGVSEEFYTFDNLITHYASSRSFHSKAESMSALLKIPVFANYYLLKMLEVSEKSFADEKRLIELTGTGWFERYVTVARLQRSKFLKHPIAKR